MVTRQHVVVRKLRDDGTEAFRWTGRLLERDERGVVVVARFNGPPGDLGYVTLEQTDLFVEFYCFDRWYNVFQIYSGQGELKGWYCNVSTPAESSDAELVYTDLVLDVFVPPSGDSLVLDEDEFAQRSQSYPPHLAQGARVGLQALLDLAKRRTLPSRPFALAEAALLEGNVQGT